MARRQSDEMKEERVKFGTLLVSVGYLKEQSIVEVDVVQASNLPGLDKSGESPHKLLILSIHHLQS